MSEIIDEGALPNGETKEEKEKRERAEIQDKRKSAQEKKTKKQKAEAVKIHIHEEVIADQQKELDTLQKRISLLEEMKIDRRLPNDDDTEIIAKKPKKSFGLSTFFSRLLHGKRK